MGGSLSGVELPPEPISPLLIVVRVLENQRRGLMATTTCIACAEEVKVGAKLCKHCGTKQDDPEFTGAIETQEEGSAETPSDSPSTSAGESPARPSKKKLVIGASIAGAIALAAIVGAILWNTQDSVALAMPGVGEQVPRVSLTTGMCPNGVPERPVNDYDTLPIVDCADEHLEEIFASQAPQGLDGWDENAIRAFAQDMCNDAFVEKTGESERESPFSIAYYVPSEEDWESGYRAVSSALFDPRGPITGEATTVTPTPEPKVVEEVAEEEVVEEPEEQAAPTNPAPSNPAPANPAPDNSAEIDALLNTIQEYNAQIDLLAREKQALIDEYESTYGPYSKDGDLYLPLDGDAGHEIDLKQSISDVENQIRILESDVLYYMGQLQALQNG